MKIGFITPPRYSYVLTTRRHKSPVKRRVCRFFSFSLAYSIHVRVITWEDVPTSCVFKAGPFIKPIRARQFVGRALEIQNYDDVSWWVCDQGHDGFLPVGTFGKCQSVCRSEKKSVTFFKRTGCFRTQQIRFYLILLIRLNENRKIYD